jgi:phage terminase large subunit-like protein
MKDLLQLLADAKAAGWREWIRTEADERALLEGCMFDIAAAERVRKFFKKFLRHSKGQWAKQPFELLEWQWQSVVAPLFGWKRKDGTRRFRRGYIEVPKKNGKSTLFSGFSLYLLAGDNEPGAEVYSAAVDRD